MTDETTQLVFASLKAYSVSVHTIHTMNKLKSIYNNRLRRWRSIFGLVHSAIYHEFHIKVSKLPFFTNFPHSAFYRRAMLLGVHLYWLGRTSL